MKYSSRFFLYAPLGVFLLLLAIASIHWWIAATRLADWLDAKNGHELMPGVTLSFATRHITGFPFSLDAQFHEVAIAVAAPNGPTRWQAETFAMHALTYGREETIFEAAGHQSLQWTRQDGVVRTLLFAVGSLRASAIVQNGSLSRFDLDLIGFGSGAFTAQRLQFHARQDAKALQLLIAADGLTNCWRSKLRYSARLTTDEAFERLQRGEQSWPDAIARWRAAGGAAPSGERIGLSALAADQALNPSALAEAVCGPS